EVRHRVGARTLGEHQVAVELVGVGALGLLADQHVAHPHGAGVPALQRALVGDDGGAVRGAVVHEEPVLEELVLVGEVQAELLEDRKSTRLNSSHVSISYAVFCLKKKTINIREI